MLSLFNISSVREYECEYVGVPHQKLLGDGLSTPITPFSLICTISSELSVILD